MDCNMPSGEAFCRQFLYGQRFFEKHFGERCKVFWLPDTFGYSAQLPQIIQNADMKYFFTQKLSWNNINKFPNTTFYWVGLDGSKVLTHMCPSETYVAQGTVDELVKSVTNNKDREYTNESLLVFGNGDGGGGPLPAMIERIRRLKDIDGLPKVEMGSANGFYERLEKESKKLVTWKGELYFELHRGTYTTHGRIKRYNRKSELLLRDVELLSSLTQYTHKPFKYPKEQLDKLWKYVLLNQFHDVLPGSSIEMVYDDAYKFYEEVEKTGEILREEALDTLFGISKSAESEHKGLVTFNTLSWERNEIVKVPVTDGLPNLQQYSENKKEGYALVKDVIGIGAQRIELDDKSEFTPVTVFEKDHSFVLANEFISITFDKHGRLTNLLDRKFDREIIPEGEFGNRFKIYEDIPLFWDAWDVEIYHLQKGREAGLGHIKIHEQGPLRASLKLETKLTKTSNLSQIISLSAISARIDFETEVYWDENRQFLKVEFPVDINRDVATYETQFGFIQRPTHYNTTWDAAKFEVCGHKFADLSEYGYGVALLNDSKYGYAIHNNIIRLSLLRSPKAPDAHCDIGHHVFKYALLPHANSFLGSNVVREAYQFNVPIIVRTTSREIAASLEPKSHFKIEGAENVILDTIKRAEDSDEIVLRLFEAYGGHAKARLRSTLPIHCICETNILEDMVSNIKYDDEDGAILKFRPFQFITLKVMLRTPLFSSTVANSKMDIKSEQVFYNSQNTQLVSDPWRKYQIEHEIGSGSFSKVYLAINRETGNTHALKEMRVDRNIDSDTLNKLSQEVVIMKNLRHPYIISLVNSYRKPDKLWLILEYLDGGDIASFIKKNEDQYHAIAYRTRCQLFARQICEALAYLHSKNIMHRDIQPKNIMITDRNQDKVKIIDFGLAKNYSDDANDNISNIGTPTYRAPELFNSSNYNCAVDMWSFGAVLYHMLNGVPPFPGEFVSEIFHSIQHSEADYSKLEKNQQFRAVDFLKKLLVVNQDSRITAIQALDHDYLKEAYNGEYLTSSPWDIEDSQPLSLPLEKFGLPISISKNNASSGNIWGVLQPVEPELQISKTPIIYLRDSSYILGRGHECSPILTFPTHLVLSNEHALIYYDNGQAYLRDISRNGIWVQGDRIPKNEDISLYGGETIYFVKIQ
ncbi:13597_t:CDS:10, partial [Ambispora gerdemannii]